MHGRIGLAYGVFAMSRRSVEIPVFRSPAGDVVEAIVAFRLVDANLVPTLGLDTDGEAVIDSAVIVSTDEAQSVQLTATDTTEPTALYRVTIASPEHKRNRAIVFLAIVPAGESELPWADVVAYAEMALANNVSNVDATSATNPLTMVGCSGARQTSGGPEGAAFWRYTQTAMSTTTFNACSVNRTTTGLTVGAWYTVVIAMKSDRYRRVEANIAGSSQSLGNHPIGDQWLYYTYNFKATATSQDIRIRFGAMLGRLDIGAWYILPGRSHAISRDFDRALVLANPGPDPYTFQLPAGANYQRLLGTQDPTVNDGSAVSGTVTVPARDGLILGKVL
jgi:hypothetical protein